MKIILLEKGKKKSLATGLSSCKFQRSAVNNSVRASKLQEYFIVESVRQPKQISVPTVTK